MPDPEHFRDFKPQNLIQYDYSNELTLYYMGFRECLRELGLNRDMLANDETLGLCVKEIRKTANCKMRTVKERYFSPKSVQYRIMNDEDRRDFQTWMNDNPSVINTLDRLVGDLNTTQNMTKFRDSYNEFVLITVKKTGQVLLPTQEPERPNNALKPAVAMVENAL